MAKLKMGDRAKIAVLLLDEQLREGNAITAYDLRMFDFEELITAVAYKIQEEQSAHTTYNMIHKGNKR